MCVCAQVGRRPRRTDMAALERLAIQIPRVHVDASVRRRRSLIGMPETFDFDDDPTHRQVGKADERLLSSGASGHANRHTGDIGGDWGRRDQHYGGRSSRDDALVYAARTAALESKRPRCPPLVGRLVGDVGRRDGDDGGDAAGNFSPDNNEGGSPLTGPSTILVLPVKRLAELALGRFRRSTQVDDDGSYSAAEERRTMDRGSRVEDLSLLETTTTRNNERRGTGEGAPAGTPCVESPSLRHDDQLDFDMVVKVATQRLQGLRQSKPGCDEEGSVWVVRGARGLRGHVKVSPPIHSSKSTYLPGAAIQNNRNTPDGVDVCTATGTPARAFGGRGERRRARATTCERGVSPPSAGLFSIVLPATGNRVSLVWICEASAYPTGNGSAWMVRIAGVDSRHVASLLHRAELRRLGAAAEEDIRKLLLQPLGS
eukprot:GHVU01058503.1.p1 GENE.GHVU01058503.1~~GHVU01058503.1.p1  ORF type:complete len:429 (-),score=39.93 GHVU01058503.1:1492-2778(-)